MTAVIKLKDLDIENLSERDSYFYQNKSRSRSRIYLNTGYIEAPYGCNEDTILVKPKENDIPKYAFFIPGLTEFKFNVRYKTDYTVFDQNGVKDQALMDHLCQPFTASFLLEPVRYNGRVDFWVKQIRVKTIKDLPDEFNII